MTAETVFTVIDPPILLASDSPPDKKQYESPKTVLDTQNNNS
jgi:hypothetical protein